MAITESQLIADIKAHKLLPIYFITGEEDYFIDEISNTLENNVVSQENQVFDQTILYGRDVTMHEVINAAQRLPMLSPQQLVMVKEAQDIGLKDNGRNQAGEWELLAKYLERPVTTTVLAFCFRVRNRKKWDKRLRVSKLIDKTGVLFEANKIYESQVPSWIGNYVKQHGYTITEKSAMMISECIGADLSKIANELNKLFVAKPEKGNITDSDVERNIGISKDFNVFELQNAIGRRDVVKCNRIINHFAANPKDNPIQMILPNLYNYFVKVMLYHQEPDKSNAASLLGVNPYFLKDYERAAANYPLQKLARCIEYLHDADRKCKGINNNTATTTDGEILKELIFKIIH